MLWFIIIAILIMLVLAIIKKIKTLIFFAIVLLIVLLIVVMKTGFLNKNIDPNWIMRIEQVGIDGESNKVFIYDNNKALIDQYMQRRKEKIQDNINIDEIIEFIKNNGTTEPNYDELCYEVVIKKYNIVRYIGNNAEINEFMDFINKAMEKVK